MKIRRYVARDMRSALAQIKEELGTEAVILSNKKIPEGVELMAAVDYNEAVPAAKIPPEGESIEQSSENATAAIMEREIDNDIVSLQSQAVNNSQNQPASPLNEDKGLSALLSRQVQTTPTVQTSHPVTSYNTNSSTEAANIKAQLKSFTERLQQSNPEAPQDVVENGMDDNSSLETEMGDNLNAASASTTPQPLHNEQETASQELVNRQELNGLKDEMASIRQLLEYQVSGLMWQDLAQKDPVKAMLVDRLIALGLNDHIADQIAGFVPKQKNQTQAWQMALNLLTRQLNTTNNDIINRGGIVALVGPTGVGKTTTIAKLAARFSQSHGRDSVALISTDTFRIAGFEQLQTYGRIIGCQVKLAKDKAELDQLIQEFSKKKLVLIDTAGMGQRDLRLVEHLTTLIANTRVRIRNYLVLAANTQQCVMQENVERFKKIPLVGCIYTKLDESLSAGEIISTAIQNGLPIGYLTDGQRVPEDIKVANAEKLVMLANKMAAKMTVNQTASRRSPTMMSAIAM